MRVPLVTSYEDTPSTGNDRLAVFRAHIEGGITNTEHFYKFYKKLCMFFITLKLILVHK